ncbi:MAG: hypothetical protein HXL06_001170 [Candidatus Nanosynbacter sp. HMT-348_TM7c-JB]|jgi:hypothetical protein cdivTM_12959|nr:MAG: hypothetical protein HXL06_001170 [Candidatus Nanosynbacter sp. HMT-348_TM7c-JB]
MNKITQERQQYSHNAAMRSINYFMDEAYADDLEKRTEALNRISRVRDYIDIFAGDVMSPEAAHAGILYEIKKEENSNIENAVVSATALMEYYTYPNTHEDAASYTAALLNDMEYMDNYATYYRNNDAWRKTSAPIDIKEMGRLSDEVNIESIIIKSCIVLDKLVEPVREVEESGDLSRLDDKVLKNITEAEIFYGPLCEVFGFDGLAMDLRSQSHVLRLLKNGKLEDVAKVREYCNSMREIGPQAVLSNIVEGNFAVFNAVKDVDCIHDYDSEIPYSSIQLGEFVTDFGNFWSGKEGDHMLTAGNWRLKSVGSLANKIQNSEKRGFPMDVMGFTFILKDEEELADVFACVIEKVILSENLECVPAPSKENWVFVQGDDNFRRLIRKRFSYDFIQKNIQVMEKDVHYRVAKLTCILLDEEKNRQMPVEMQFLTKEDRKNARTGTAAHIIYKAQSEGIFYSADDRERASKILTKMYNRKTHMYDSVSTLEANTESLIRGTGDMDRVYMFSCPK